MQLAMESKEQQLRAQSSFEEGLRAKLSTGSPSFLGEQAAPVSQRRGKLGSKYLPPQVSCNDGPHCQPQGRLSMSELEAGRARHVQ